MHQYSPRHRPHKAGNDVAIEHEAQQATHTFACCWVSPKSIDRFMTSWGARISHTERAPLLTTIPLPPTARLSAARHHLPINNLQAHIFSAFSMALMSWWITCKDLMHRIHYMPKVTLGEVHDSPLPVVGEKLSRRVSASCMMVICRMPFREDSLPRALAKQLLRDPSSRRAAA